MILKNVYKDGDLTRVDEDKPDKIDAVAASKSKGSRKAGRVQAGFRQGAGRVQAGCRQEASRRQLGCKQGASRVQAGCRQTGCKQEEDR